MFVVFEEYRSGGATSVHREACGNYVARDAEASLGRWLGPFSILAEANRLATQLAEHSGARVALNVECCRAEEAIPADASRRATAAPQFEAPAVQEGRALKRILLIVMITSLSVTAAVGILVFLFGSFDDTSLKILGTTSVIGAYSLAGLCGAIWFDRRRYLPLAAATIAGSGAGLLLAVALIWGMLDNSFKDTVWKTLALQITWTAFSVHTSLNMLSYGGTAVVRRIVQGTVGSAGLIAAIITAIVLAEPHEGDFIGRVIGVLGILATLGTIVAPLARRMTSVEARS